MQTNGAAFQMCASPVFAARQEDPGEIQPLLGRSEQEQAGGGGVVHGPPHLPAHRHPGLLLHPSLHDGVSLSVYCCLQAML